MTHDEFDDQVEQAFTRGGPHARARLASLAAADPELGRRLEELEPALDALSGAKLEPVPDELHATLIEAARAVEPRRVIRGVSWLSLITSAIQARPAFALGGAVAAGIAIGAFGFALISGTSGIPLFRSAEDAASGISASLPPAPATEAVTTLDRGDTHVVLGSRREDGTLVIRVDARADQDASLTLEWDPAALKLSGVRWEAMEAPTFQPAPGRVQLPIPLASDSELTLTEIVSGPSTVRATLRVAGGEAQEFLRIPTDGRADH